MNKTETIAFRVDKPTLQRIESAMKKTKRKTKSDFALYCIETVLETIK